MTEAAERLKAKLAALSGEDREELAQFLMESLPDGQILALCDSMMDLDQQVELGDLLAASREGLLTADQGTRLRSLMQVYRRGLVRKAQALQLAVKRGLRPPLS
jgi:hypothetical protein